MKGITFGQQKNTGGQTSVPTPAASLVMRISLDGVEQVITRKQLLDLAAQGTIGPDTVATMNGKPFRAGQVKGIVFGQPQLPTSLPPVDEFSWDSYLTPSGGGEICRRNRC